jgi:predicted alpha-1,6-mannanase (GH76 family)
LQARSESVPGGFAEKTQPSLDPLMEIDDYERTMNSHNRSNSRVTKARWSVQGSGLNLHDYQDVMLFSEAAQLRKDYIAKKIRESNAMSTVSEQHYTPLAPTVESARSSTEELTTENDTLFHATAPATIYESEWLEDDGKNKKNK